MQKYRVYELAKQYNKTGEEVISILKKHQINVSSNFNSVDEKAKDILDRELGGKKPEKKMRKARTVRFDRGGRPQGSESRQMTAAHAGPAQEVVIEQPGKTAEGKPAVKAEAKAVPAPRKDTAPAAKAEGKTERPVQVSAGNRQERTRQESRDRQGRRDGQGREGSRPGDRPRRDGDRPGFGSRPARSGDTRRNDGRPDRNNDRNGRGGQRPQSGSGRPARPGDRPARRPAAAAPARPAPEPTRAAKPVHKKKDKKDYERSRREREGTSLMAQSMKQNRKKKHVAEKKAVALPTEVRLPASVTVKELATLFGREVSEVIKHLMSLGIMATINQNVDADAAALLADEFGITLLEPEKVADPTAYEPAPDDPAKLRERPPIVTIMGHVDHGKTTLLDAIRSTNVAAHEAGGITQSIGAYQIRYKNQKITFIDTPGHEAFTAMRTRGAQITDIAVIIVAADDGVMPQTIEAIHHAKSAGVPIMVAINKIDKPGANPDHIKEELSHQGLIAEDWGGDVIMVPISAKKKIGLDDLLDNILLVAEMQELKANPDREAYGVVVEAELDKGRGPVMHVLVQNGTLRKGDGILAGKAWGRVRAMTNENGRRLDKAAPSSPAEVLGMSSVPEAGDHFYVMDEKKAREIAEMRAAKAREEEQGSVQKVTLDNIFEKIKEGEMKELNLVIKADVQGSVEALQQSFAGIKSEKVRVVVVHAAVGAISESDIMLASASNALIIGFNVRPDAKARDLAEKEKVDIRLYRVIYDAIDDVKAAMTGLLAPKIQEVHLGEAEVRQVIHTPKVIVAGCYVSEGKIPRTAMVRLVRDGIVVHEGKLGSLRRFKDDVKEVTEGFECGLSIDGYRDIKEGDTIEAFKLEETAAELE